MIYFNTKDTPIIITSPEQIDEVYTKVWMSWKCVRCGKEVVIQKRKETDRINRYKTLLCQPCYSKHVKKEKYGDENYNNHEQAMETTSKRTPEQIAQTNEKRKETLLRTRGVDHPMHDPEVIQKVMDIAANRTDEQKAESIRKLRATWNSKTQEEKNTIRDKNMQSRINNFETLGIERSINGKPDYSNRTQAMETTKEHIGYISRSSDPNFINQMYIHRSPFYYYGVYFDSGWELAVWIYCHDHGISITREPVRFEFKDINGTTRYCYPDFMINGKLVEVKGKQFFRPDGTMYCPFRHKDESDEEYEFICDLYERKHQCELEHGVEFWKQEDIEYMKLYINRTYGYSYLNSFRRNNPLNPSYWCITDVIGMVNPQYYPMILCNSLNDGKGVTPYDVDQTQQYAPISGKGITPFD